MSLYGFVGIEFETLSSSASVYSCATHHLSLLVVVLLFYKVIQYLAGVCLATVSIYYMAKENTTFTSSNTARGEGMRGGHIPFVYRSFAPLLSCHLSSSVNICQWWWLSSESLKAVLYIMPAMNTCQWWWLASESREAVFYNMLAMNICQ